MSKKIKVPLDNIRYCLHDLFFEYLDEMYELEKTRRHHRSSPYDYMDDDEVIAMMQAGFIFPGLEDDYGNYYEDDAVQVWPVKKDKKDKKKDNYVEFWEREERKSKHKHGKKNKARIIDITQPYSGEEDNPTEYATYEDLDSDGIFDGKMIYYYPDYHNKHDRLEFNTLKEFDDFCADCGYIVPPYTAENIAYRRVSHTCLRPSAREEGIFEIMSEESYADMVYEACDVVELSQ